MVDLLVNFEKALMGGVCTVERRANDWAFSFKSGEITTAAPWRVVTGGRIQLGDTDVHPALEVANTPTGEARTNALLQGRHVRAIKVDRATADLCVLFDADTWLEIFNDSVGQEAWSAKFVVADQSMSIVGMGGGAVGYFSAESAPPATAKPARRASKAKAKVRATAKSGAQRISAAC